jgi:hypothetical protein
LSVWKRAYDELLSRIACGELEVTGVQDGARRSLDSKIFIAMSVDYPFGDTPRALRFTDELFLRSYPHIDEAHWAGGFDDSLCDRFGAKVTKLMVDKARVGRLWPFELSTSEIDETAARTGAPGRPSSMHLIKSEHRARWGRGEAMESVGKEAEYLAGWFDRTHPGLPSVTKKTIENSIREEHRLRSGEPRK